MCIIIVKQIGIPLREDRLRYCFDKNPHGAGFAVQKADKIIIEKGFYKWEEFLDAVKEHILDEDRAILHCRIRTHGNNDAGNTHPFPITDDIKMLRTESLITTESVVAHNGTIRNVTPSKEKLSDTQEFIRAILSDKGIKTWIWKSEAIQKLIKEFINSSRLALMHPKYEILTIGEFYDESGISYSNTGYKPFVSVKSSYSPRNTRYHNGYGYGYGNSFDIDDDWGEMNLRLYKLNKEKNDWEFVKPEEIPKVPEIPEIDGDEEEELGETLSDTPSEIEEENEENVEGRCQLCEEKHDLTAISGIYLCEFCKNLMDYQEYLG